MMGMKMAQADLTANNWREEESDREIRRNREKKEKERKNNK